ncbi:MAG: aminotransferase class IV, partial [Pseudomonadota bacterium]
MIDEAHGAHDFVYDARNADIKVSINGELKHRDEATVSVFDSGYILGDGVWEGMRVYRGGVAFLEEHFKRLYAGAKTIDMEIGLTPAEL